MPRKSKTKAGRVVRRKLADGSVREYRYAAYRPKRVLPAGDTLEALIQAYRRSPEWDALAKHTREVYAIYLRPLEAIGQIKVLDMKRRELLIVRDSINKGSGPGAAKGFIRAAGALFKWAIKREWIEHNPAHGGTDGLPGGELRAWTREQADAAQAELPEHLRRVVVLARYTGQRRGDLCALTWSAYDGFTLRLKQQKTGERLVLAVHPALKAELDAWRLGTVVPMPAAPILTNTLGRPWKPQHLSHELPVALGRLGMPRDLNVHGLRKLAAAELADIGCSTHEIAAVTGHRTLSMIALYTRSADQERLAASAVVKWAADTKTYKRRKDEGGN